MKVGDTVRAPWRIYGDDTNLTGVITSIRNGYVNVRWNGDGDVTPEGDESSFRMDDTEVMNLLILEF